MKSVIRNIGRFKVQATQDYTIIELEKMWLGIQQQTDPPFFLSWAWISCWVKTYHPAIIVVTASVDSTLVSIGLFTESIEYRHGFISSKQLRLHQTGDLKMDQIWMEYNDFLCLSEFKADAVNASLQALGEIKTWDEIIISMMQENRARQLYIPKSCISTDLVTPGFSVDLSELATSGKPYIESLSPNTRYQIRKSIRLYEQTYGELVLQHATTTAEALELFHEAGNFHIQRWQDSGYLNQDFLNFHENLIRNGFDQGQIHLIKAKAGNETIAILYFHLINQSVYFYLHGLRYEPNRKLKPGLVAHALATQFYLDEGMKTYDYMGGFSQYKKQLSRPSGNMCTVCIQRPRIRFRVENLARTIKKKLFRDH